MPSNVYLKIPKVKQTIAVKGLSSRSGSMHQPVDITYDEDSEVVTRLRRAGAIPMLISNTPEISCGYESYNYVTGITRNPYNLARSAGGSSGGEGALLASDAVVFGLGTDTAGSIRLPSHWNGVCGHKTTPGVVSMDGIYPMFPEPLVKKHNVCGPMAKNVRDLKILLDIMAMDVSKLKEPPKKIKVLYATQLAPRIIMMDVVSEIQSKIQKKIAGLSKNFDIEPFDTEKFYNLPETVTYKLTVSCRYPYLLQRHPTYLHGHPSKGRAKKEIFPTLWKEILKNMICLSNFTYNLIFFEFIKRWRGMLFDYKRWKEPADQMEQDFIVSYFKILII